MATSEKEYVVVTVRPTNRPEAGQELDLDSLRLGLRHPIKGYGRLLAEMPS